MVKIIGTEKRSRAERAGIKSGDILVSVNGNAIRDVLDYRFYICEALVSLLIRRGDEELTVTLKKGEYEDPGLLFETPLMDKKHSCRNKCIFCFIDQLPSGMRDTLYFKDDDARLSFLHGNYITLTNLSDEDIDRIIKMHISPVNISVHTTNPELRVKMMGNPRSGEVLSYLPRLTEAGIKVCAQIVLCKGINDKRELDRTMRELAELAPGVSSVSVVPAGLTDHRKGLFPLSVFEPKEAAAVLEQVNSFGDKCLSELGTRLVYPADEFYLKAGIPVPGIEYYEDFEQIENGVGMLAMMDDEFRAAICDLRDEYSEKELASFRGSVSVATGKAAYPLISGCLDLLSGLCYNKDIRVYEIENRFFGKNITVSGLLTGRDVAEQLAGIPLGDRLILPGNMLRAEGDVFLDGMSPAELSELLGVPVLCPPCGGAELVNSVLGLS